MRYSWLRYEQWEIRFFRNGVFFMEQNTSDSAAEMLVQILNKEYNVWKNELSENACTDCGGKGKIFFGYWDNEEKFKDCLKCDGTGLEQNLENKEEKSEIVEQEGVEIYGFDL